MKKVLSVIILLALITSLFASCGKPSTKTASSAPSSSSEANKEESEVSSSSNSSSSAESSSTTSTASSSTVTSSHTASSSKSTTTASKSATAPSSTGTKSSGTATKPSGTTSKASTTTKTGGSTTGTNTTTNTQTADPRYVVHSQADETRTQKFGNNTVKLNLNAIVCEMYLDQSSVKDYMLDQFVIQVYKNGVLTNKGNSCYYVNSDLQTYSTINLDYYAANNHWWFSPATYTIKCYAQKSDHSMVTENRPDRIDCPSATFSFTVWEQGFKN